ncbi:MAG: hypothetical protein ACREQ1_03410 [Woeseiaceae bacterium]
MFARTSSRPVRNRLIGIAITVAALTLVLFEVEIDPQFSLPTTVERPDDGQEARFERCVDDRTDEATRRAFEAADNPDVQSLMIRMEQQEAIADCRGRFPEQRVDVEEPLRINIIDLRWRF